MEGQWGVSEESVGGHVGGQWGGLYRCVGGRGGRGGGSDMLEIT